MDPDHADGHTTAPISTPPNFRKPNAGFSRLFLLGYEYISQESSSKIIVSEELLMLLKAVTFLHPLCWGYNLPTQRPGPQLIVVPWFGWAPGTVL